MNTMIDTATAAVTIRVADCMSRQFVRFHPTTPVVEAAIEMVQNELLGGPVVDDSGRLIGWISEQDCLKVVAQVAYYSERVATVADIMRTDVLTVSIGDDVMDLAERMLQQLPKIYPVTDGNGMIKGIISRRMILRRLCILVSTLTW